LLKPRYTCSLAAQHAEKSSLTLQKYNICPRGVHLLFLNSIDEVVTGTHAQCQKQGRDVAKRGVPIKS
jgi:hypothetical protein